MSDPLHSLMWKLEVHGRVHYWFTCWVPPVASSALDQLLRSSLRIVLSQLVQVRLLLLFFLLLVLVLKLVQLSLQNLLVGLDFFLGDVLSRADMVVEAAQRLPQVAETSIWCGCILVVVVLGLLLLRSFFFADGWVDLLWCF